jgi:SAM-dependent methyltransferase
MSSPNIQYCLPKRQTTVSRLDRNGLASSQDTETQPYLSIYSLLEEEQEYFLSHDHLFRSSDYKWPRDSLHNWSRVWEYPYVFHHLRNMVQQSHGMTTRVVDVGSGVTFFPFSLARRLSMDIVCTDVDAVAERDIVRAASCVAHIPGTITFRRTDGVKLPFDDASVDAAYCISVLEHIKRPEGLIAEIARVLRPRGIFILTIDLAIEGDGDIKPKPHGSLVQKIAEFFDYAVPDITVHPASLLTSDNSKYPLFPSNAIFRVRQFLKVLAPTRGKKPRLAVQGFALIKR